VIPLVPRGRVPPGGHALVARLDNDGDVLLAGPAIRAVAAGSERVTLLERGRALAAAAAFPCMTGIGVDEVLHAIAAIRRGSRLRSDVPGRRNAPQPRRAPMADQEHDPKTGSQEQEQEKWSENPQQGGPSQGAKDSGEGIGPDDADKIVNAGEG